jgi:glutaminyl-peptide cyclotransferase
MYESTGQYGQSSLRRVRLEDGKVLAQRKLGPKLFGEGLERIGERLIQLTWRAGLALVSDLNTLEERQTLSSLSRSAPELRRTPYLSTFSDLRQGV